MLASLAVPKKPTTHIASEVEKVWKKAGRSSVAVLVNEVLLKACGCLYQIEAATWQTFLATAAGGEKRPDKKLAVAGNTLQFVLTYLARHIGPSWVSALGLPGGVTGEHFEGFLVASGGDLMKGDTELAEAAAAGLSPLLDYETLILVWCRVQQWKKAADKVAAIKTPEKVEALNQMHVFPYISPTFAEKVFLVLKKSGTDAALRALIVGEDVFTASCYWCVEVPLQRMADLQDAESRGAVLTWSTVSSCLPKEYDVSFWALRECAESVAQTDPSANLVSFEGGKWSAAGLQEALVRLPGTLSIKGLHSLLIVLQKTFCAFRRNACFTDALLADMFDAEQLKENDSVSDLPEETAYTFDAVVSVVTHGIASCKLHIARSNLEHIMKGPARASSELLDQVRSLLQGHSGWEVQRYVASMCAIGAAATSAPTLASHSPSRDAVLALVSVSSSECCVFPEEDAYRVLKKMNLIPRDPVTHVSASAIRSYFSDSSEAKEMVALHNTDVNEAVASLLLKCIVIFKESLGKPTDFGLCVLALRKLAACTLHIDSAHTQRTLIAIISNAHAHKGNISAIGLRGVLRNLLEVSYRLTGDPSFECVLLEDEQEQLFNYIVERVVNYTALHMFKGKKAALCNVLDPPPPCADESLSASQLDTCDTFQGPTGCDLLVIWATLHEYMLVMQQALLKNELAVSTTCNAEALMSLLHINDFAVVVRRMPATGRIAELCRPGKFAASLLHPFPPVQLRELRQEGGLFLVHLAADVVYGAEGAFYALLRSMCEAGDDAVHADCVTSALVASGHLQGYFPSRNEAACRCLVNAALGCDAPASEWCAFVLWVKGFVGDEFSLGCTPWLWGADGAPEELVATMVCCVEDYFRCVPRCKESGGGKTIRADLAPPAAERTPKAVAHLLQGPFFASIDSFLYAAFLTLLFAQPQEDVAELPVHKAFFDTVVLGPAFVARTKVAKDQAYSEVFRRGVMADYAPCAQEAHSGDERATLFLRAYETAYVGLPMEEHFADVDRQVYDMYLEKMRYVGTVVNYVAHESSALTGTGAVQGPFLKALSAALRIPSRFLECSGVVTLKRLLYLQTQAAFKHTTALQSPLLFEMGQGIAAVLPEEEAVEHTVNLFRRVVLCVQAFVKDFARSFHTGTTAASNDVEAGEALYAASFPLSELVQYARNAHCVGEKEMRYVFSDHISKEVRAKPAVPLETVLSEVKCDFADYMHYRAWHACTDYVFDMLHVRGKDTLSATHLSRFVNCPLEALEAVHTQSGVEPSARVFPCGVSDVSAQQMSRAAFSQYLSLLGQT